MLRILGNGGVCGPFLNKWNTKMWIYNARGSAAENAFHKIEKFLGTEKIKQFYNIKEIIKNGYKELDNDIVFKERESGMSFSIIANKYGYTKGQVTSLLRDNYNV